MEELQRCRGKVRGSMGRIQNIGCSEGKKEEDRDGKNKRDIDIYGNRKWEQ